MCPDCERLKVTPTLTGRHLVDPGNPHRHARDIHDQAVCPVCDALWSKEAKRPWWLEREPEPPKAKRAKRK